MRPNVIGIEAMQLREFPLNQLMVAEVVTPTKDAAWPMPSIFNLNFVGGIGGAQVEAALRGKGLYLITYGNQVIYLGIYRPDNGNIVADRWGRHMQTITGRGSHIGFHGKASPEHRLNRLLKAVEAEELRQYLRNALAYSRDERFRDTGNNTSLNRLRFASENWATFGTAGPDTIMRGFEFRLLQIHSQHDETVAREVVEDIEKVVLEQWHPVCNREYVHKKDCARRGELTPEALVAAVRQVTRDNTGADVDCLVHFRAAA